MQEKENKTYRELDTMIRARYPILYFRTYEEGRAEQMISQIVREQSVDDTPMELFVWSISQGVRSAIGDSQVTSTNDPIAILDVIEKHDKPAVFILRDYHKFIDENVPNRKLRDLYDSLKASDKTIIILAPVTVIPLELMKSITPIELPLPTKTELNTVMEGLMPSVKKAASKKVIASIDKDLDNGNRDAILSAGLGFTGDEFENALTRTLIDAENLDIPTIIREKEQIVKKSGVLTFYTSLADMQDVGGHGNLKLWVEKRKMAFTPKAIEFGLKLPRGVFLTGVPGTGKSLMAKVIAKYLQFPLLKLDASKIFASHVGESEQNIAYAFDLAEAVAPSILWIDEVEKVFAGSQSSGELDSGVTSRVIGEALTWLQEHESPVFSVVTCNNPHVLPPEFMRAGRFDEVFFADLPDEPERTDIFGIHIRKAKRTPEKFDLKALARKADGFSGAEIEAVVQSAMYDAYFAKNDLQNTYIMDAIDRARPLSKMRPQDIERMRKWGDENAVSSSLKPQTEEKAVKRRIGFKDKDKE